jgi:hypothetical protein
VESDGGAAGDVAERGGRPRPRPTHGRAFEVGIPRHNDEVMKTVTQFRGQAEFLRESSGSTNIEKTLLKALKVLKIFNIPHYVCGGFAVQEHGYPRFTIDVDLIVPDVQLAREKLAMNGFKANPGSKMTVTDRETKVEIDVLPGGGKVGPGSVSFPMPKKVSEKPQILALPDLIALKLSSYMGSPIDRAQDYADAIKLIQVNHPSRELNVDASIRGLYQTLWDQIHRQRLT